MFKVIRMLTILSFAFSLCGMASFALASSRPVRTLEYTFKPVEMPKKAGPVKIELAFKRKHAHDKYERALLNCDEVKIKIKRLHNLDYTGDTAWVMQVDSGKWYKTIIEINIPPNAVSGIEVELKCGPVPNPAACYFVTTGDTVEFYRGKPSGHDPTPPPRSLKTFIDTLTEQQLQTKYEVIVELKTSLQRKFVEKFVGSLKDSTLHNTKRKHYKLWITLENLIKIGEEGIEGDFVTPPPWDTRNRSPKDSTKYQDSTNNSLKQPGCPIRLRWDK